MSDQLIQRELVSANLRHILAKNASGGFSLIAALTEFIELLDKLPMKGKEAKFAVKPGDKVNFIDPNKPWHAVTSWNSPAAAPLEDIKAYKKKAMLAAGYGNIQDKPLAQWEVDLYNPDGMYDSGYDSTYEMQQLKQASVEIPLGKVSKETMDMLTGVTKEEPIAPVKHYAVKNPDCAKPYVYTIGKAVTSAVKLRWMPFGSVVRINNAKYKKLGGHEYAPWKRITTMKTASRTWQQMVELYKQYGATVVSLPD